MIKIPQKIEYDLRSGLQNAETVQDSLTQRLQRKLGKDHKFSRDAFYVLKQIRKMQFRYFPVKTHSLLRYSDNTRNNKGERIAKSTRLDKHNWKKYKKLKDRKKKNKKLDEFS